MNCLNHYRKFAAVIIVLFWPFAAAFADGCDDLLVSIDNNTGLPIKSYYTHNSEGYYPEQNIVTILPNNKPDNKPTDLPLIINKGAREYVYADIILKTEAEKNLIELNLSDKEDVLLHTGVISITKYYSDAFGALTSSVNYIATDCQRDIWLKTGRRYPVIPACNRTRMWDEYETSQLDPPYAPSQNNYDSLFPNHITITAELKSYGYCAGKNDPRPAEPGQVIIHINKVNNPSDG